MAQVVVAAMHQQQVKQVQSGQILAAAVLAEMEEIKERPAMVEKVHQD
jgi:hypothetical protein